MMAPASAGPRAGMTESKGGQGGNTQGGVP